MSDSTPKRRRSVSPFTETGKALVKMNAKRIPGNGHIHGNSGAAFASEPPTSVQAIADKPPMGEATGAQSGGGKGGFAVLVGGDVPGYGQPSEGSFNNYRRMRANPTIAMARAIATVPIMLPTISVEGADGVDQKWIDFIDSQITPMWPHIVKNCALALDYGFQAFEKVFEIDGSGMTVLRKLKPLSPDHTNPIVDDHGVFMGLEQEKVVLPANKVFWYVNDMEAGNWFGRSRHENCRASWTYWLDAAKKFGTYSRKIAGVIPIIMYPEGRSKNASGQDVDNYDLAVKMLQSLGGNMEGFAMPNALAKFAFDLLQRGADIDQLRPWILQFVETKQKHGDEFISALSYWDKQLARGWLVPERTFQEGEHGTKAEAGAHGDLVLSIAQQILGDIVRCVNWYIVNQLLALNFPTSKPGDVFITPGPIVDEDAEFIRSIVTKMIEGEGAAEAFAMIDADALLTRSGLPLQPNKARDLVTQLLDVVDKPADPNAPPVDPGATPKPDGGAPDINGNTAVVPGEKLNGAQIEAAKGVITDIIFGRMPPEAGFELLVAVGIEEARARRMLESLKGFKPAVAETPATTVPGDDKGDDDKGGDAPPFPPKDDEGEGDDDDDDDDDDE